MGAITCDRSTRIILYERHFPGCTRLKRVISISRASPPQHLITRPLNSKDKKCIYISLLGSIFFGVFLWNVPRRFSDVIASRGDLVIRNCGVGESLRFQFFLFFRFYCCDENKHAVTKG